MLKKLFCLLLAVLTATAPLSAAAVDLGSAFNGLLGNTTVSVNKPGAFSSQARTGFSAGGIEVRVPRQTGSTPQLLSITPPRIVAGCSGISAHFGGFSFISGAEFTALLKQIASGAAMGFVTSLVMKTLCPPCEAIVQELKTAAANAARLARDGCEIGKRAGLDFANSLGYRPDSQSLCASTEPEDGGSKDSLLAWTGVCSSINSAAKWLKDFNQRTGPASDNPAAKDAQDALGACSTGAGNMTWARLAVFDTPGRPTSDGSAQSATDDEANYKRRLLLINIMGADLFEGADTDKASCTLKDGTVLYNTDKGPVAGVVFCPPPADTKLLTGFFLCGVPEGGNPAPGSDSTRIRDYCSKFFNSASAAVPSKVWACGGGIEGRKRCLNLVDSDGSELVGGQGFLVKVNNLLVNAAKRVSSGTGFRDPQGVEIMKLVEVAPYPLYQAINAAAVYPAAGIDLLDSMSILVAEQFAYALLDESLKMSDRTTSGACRMTQQQASLMMDFINGFRRENASRRELIGQQFALQQALTRQIHEISLAIQQQVMSPDMLQAGRLAQTLNGVVSPRSSSASTEAPAP